MPEISNELSGETGTVFSVPEHSAALADEPTQPLTPADVQLALQGQGATDTVPSAIYYEYPSETDKVEKEPARLESSATMSQPDELAVEVVDNSGLQAIDASREKALETRETPGTNPERQQTTDEQVPTQTVDELFPAPPQATKIVAVIGATSMEGTGTEDQPLDETPVPSNPQADGTPQAETAAAGGAGEGGDGGDSPRGETPEDDEPEDGEHREEVSKIVGLADKLMTALEYADELADTRPTFRVADDDVVIFHDAPREPDADENVPPARVAFSVTEPERRVPVEALDVHSSWVGGHELQREGLYPTSHPSLDVVFVHEELDNLSPEPRIVSPAVSARGRTEEVDVMEEVDTQVLSADPAKTASSAHVTIMHRVTYGFQMSASEAKSLVTTKVGDNDEPTTFMERHYSDQFVIAWQRYAWAGVPVPPELHLTSEGKLLVADIKAGGKEIYDKTIAMGIYHGDDRIYPHPEIDPLFLDIMEHQHDEVEAAVHEIAERATAHGIRMATDDPLGLLVDPDGTWSLMALDLTETRTDIGNDPLLSHKNRVIARKLIGQLDTIAQYIQRPSTNE